MSCKLTGTYEVYRKAGATTVVTLRVALGESTAGSGTGVLGNGVTVSSATVSQGLKPIGAADLTFGTPSVFSGTVYVDGVAYGSGEGCNITCTLAAAQAVGEYQFILIPTLSNSDTGPPLIGTIIVKAIPS